MAGTAGFLVNAYHYILESHTSPEILEYDPEGLLHHLIGDQLSDAQWTFIRSDKALRGFDSDSGMTMLRIGSMNLMLHGIDSPQFFYNDTLSKAFDQERLAELKTQAALLKAERLGLHAEINRLTFEQAIAPEGDGPIATELTAAQAQLAELVARWVLLQTEIERLSRQFWVSKAQVKANKFDLSISRYRVVEHDEEYHEKPQVTIGRMIRLEKAISDEIHQLWESLK